MPCFHSGALTLPSWALTSDIWAAARQLTSSARRRSVETRMRVAIGVLGVLGSSNEPVGAGDIRTNQANISNSGKWLEISLRIVGQASSLPHVTALRRRG